MSDIFAQLAAPFRADAIHWRAQSLTKDGDKAMALAYMDARDVMARLDEVVGPANWQDTYEETPKGRILCTLAIRVDGEWIRKSDGAGNTDVEGDKGALSDAMKRAAVKWGIGRYLYDMPTPWVECESYERNGKRHWKKWTDAGLRRLASLGGQAPAPRTSESDGSLQFALDAIAKCDTEMALRQWWKQNGKAFDDANAERVVEAISKRIAVVKAMATVAA